MCECDCCCFLSHPCCAFIFNVYRVLIQELTTIIGFTYVSEHIIFIIYVVNGAFISEMIHRTDSRNFFISNLLSSVSSFQCQHNIYISIRSSFPYRVLIQSLLPKVVLSHFVSFLF